MLIFCNTATTVTSMPSTVRSWMYDQVYVGLYVCAFEWGPVSLAAAGTSDMTV